MGENSMNSEHSALEEPLVIRIFYFYLYRNI